jgi:hypothetical protein
MSGLDMFSWGLNIVQAIAMLIGWLLKSAHDKHLAAVREQSIHLRAMCSEAIDKGEIIKTDPQRQFVRQIAYSLLGIEKQIDAAIGEKKAP